MSIKMTKIIAVLNQKGGVGKTTITSNLGEAFKRDGYKVLLIDADPQGSLRDWNDASEGATLPVVGLDRNSLPNDIKAVKNQYDYIFIDGAPQSSELAAAAIRTADFVLIPVTPSAYDIWACGALVEAIKSRQILLDGIPHASFLISRKIKGTKLGSEIYESLDGYGLNVLESSTTQRQIYAQTVDEGLTVFHVKKAVEAMAEVLQIKDEILEIFENGN